ncbi:DUF2079 domain-containing protein [Streptomyces sp. NPDC127084]|uniref:DUF2079 domain-containing protein n=1 Tax=Streptomyces sp. NPDC127084 TaxID=3347133 RepID=UPI00364EEF04
MNALSLGTLRPRLAVVLPKRQTPADAAPAGERGVGWQIWSLVGVLFFLYMLLSLRTHERMLSNSFDLAIFEQVVHSYAHGRLPVSEVKGPDFPVLGDHFSPILATLAPFYWLWPSVKTLLVAQAALVAVSVVPLALWVRRTLGLTAALVVGAAYGLSWGIASAVGFDFHEVAFAVPFLAFSLAALGQERLRAAAWWAMPLLLVKEDLGLAVCVIGLLIARRGARRLGLITAGIGLGASLLTVLVILPAFSPSGDYGHWSGLDSVAAGDGDWASLLYRGTIGVITPMTKPSALLLSLAPTLFLAVRSPLILVAVPTFGWRFVSHYSANWGVDYHYSLVVMTIVFAAFIDALVRRRPGTATLRRYLAGTAAITLLLLPQFSFWKLVQPATWHSDPRIGTAREVMRLIPDGDTVQASTFLVPQLAGRTSVSLFGWPDSRPNPQWILVDTALPDNRRWPLSYLQERAALDAARARGYSTAASTGGFVLLRRS